jgi:hypothetical protein
MFFSESTSSAAFTVLLAGTEKKPACFFISSSCFAVFVGLSITTPPFHDSCSPRSLSSGPTRSPSRRRGTHTSESENVANGFGRRLQSSLDHGPHLLFVGAGNSHLHANALAASSSAKFFSTRADWQG